MLVEAVAPLMPAMEPSTIELLWLTEAAAPTAEALVSVPSETSASEPTAVLL